MKRINAIICTLSIILLLTSAGFAGVARITKIKGSITCLKTDQTRPIAASVGMELNVGDKLNSAEKSSVKIKFNSGHKTILGENSTMVIGNTDNNKTNLELFSGRLRAKVKKLSKKQDFTIKTPQAVCAVRGTDFSVNVTDNTTRVEVYAGVVEAKELITGEKLEIFAGQSSDIIKNQKPTQSSGGPLDDLSRGELQERAEALEAARMEMFQEISKDAVMSRAAEEIKKAEYENGKAMIDVHGNRLRLEEYIVRPEDYQFKYVVLNNRTLEGGVERFDFSKILFTFNKTLPDDLTLVSRYMYYSVSEEKPQLILTDMISVVSNTQDQINELASDGDMLQDENGAWRHYYGLYEFFIKGYGKTYADPVQGKKLYAITKTDVTGKYEGLSGSYSYLDNTTTTGPVTENTSPDGTDVFHFYEKSTYEDGTWLAVDDYLIDDDGNVKTSSELEDNFASSFGGSFTDYLSELNFEKKYTSSEFDNRDIDIVFSTKLLLDSGMLSVAYDGD